MYSFRITLHECTCAQNLTTVSGIEIKWWLSSIQGPTSFEGYAVGHISGARSTTYRQWCLHVEREQCKTARKALLGGF